VLNDDTVLHAQNTFIVTVVIRQLQGKCNILNNQDYYETLEITVKCGIKF